MTTVLINATTAKHGGAVTYIKNLLACLADDASDIQYIVYAPPQHAAQLSTSSRHVSVVATDVGYKPYWYRLLWEHVILRRELKRRNAQLLVATSEFGMLWPPCRQLLMIRNPLFFSDVYARAILPQKNFRYRLLFRLKQVFIHFAIRHSLAVMTASLTMLESVQNHVDLHKHRTTVNPFGVPLAKFRPHAPRDASPYRLLFVTEYADYKNLTTLLRAVQILRDKGVTDVELITPAHPSHFPESESITREEDVRLADDLRDLVRFTGAVPYATIESLYEQSDLFVYPSLIESFGHPMVEAMASGLPILAADTAINREICGEAAAYFQPLNADELAAKIIELRSDSSRLASMAKLGRTRAEEHFDWQAHMRRMVQLIATTAVEQVAQA